MNVLADVGARPERVDLDQYSGWPTALLTTAAAAASGPHPAAPALVTGMATWLVLTARHDLTPREEAREARPPKTR